MIDVLLVVGVAVVLPLALGGPWRWWLASALGVVVALALPVGLPAAALVLPWVAATALTWWRRPSLPALWAVVAAGSLVVSRLGWTVLGIEEPIVQLTAVHYTYAGAAALVLARATGDRLAVVATAVAPPIVALGFSTHHPLPQVGGAVLLTVGVWATAVRQLVEGVRGRRVLLVVSGLAPWAAMVLAVAWAAGQHWDVPILSIPDMAKVHGVLNGIGFSVCGLLARKEMTWRSRERSTAACS